MVKQGVRRQAQFALNSQRHEERPVCFLCFVYLCEKLVCVQTKKALSFLRSSVNDLFLQALQIQQEQSVPLSAVEQGAVT